MPTHGQPQTPPKKLTRLGALSLFTDFGEKTEDRRLPKVKNW